MEDSDPTNRFDCMVLPGSPHAGGYGGRAGHESVKIKMKPPSRAGSNPSALITWETDETKDVFSLCNAFTVEFAL